MLVLNCSRSVWPRVGLLHRRNGGARPALASALGYRAIEEQAWRQVSSLSPSVLPSSASVMKSPAGGLTMRCSSVYFANSMAA
jgi:hypothetical protein